MPRGSPEQRRAVARYAQKLGRAFQIRDDMLDVTGTTEEFGKPVGSDRSREKSTFVTALGLEGSGALVEQLTEGGSVRTERIPAAGLPSSGWPGSWPPGGSENRRDRRE